MRRRTQTEQFKVCFPHVDIKTTAGMMMFQGFLAGYNKAQENHKADKDTFKRKLEVQKIEIEELKGHIQQMRLVSFNSWDVVGDEHH